MSAATDIAARWSKAFNAGDPKAFVECFAADATQQHPMFPAPAKSRDEIFAREAPLFEAFSDISLDVVQIVESGDRAVVEGLIKATNTGDLPTPGGVVPATGRTVSIPTVSVIRLDADGLVAEERRYMDVAGFMVQLGLMPS